jgi:N12 class adenine-specific DNA methylase/SAM-dependent methyltransferase
MPKSSSSQLGLFNSSSLGWGFDLGLGGAPGARRFREPVDEDVQSSAIPEPKTPRLPAITFRLVGDRALALGWKARAADTIAAIRLARQIEDEARPATAGEQERLAKFTGFGATDLANSFFRRAGEEFRPGWEDLGNELERLVSREEMAALARSTQYAHFTPEFMVRAVWRAVAAMGFGGGTVLEPGCGTGLFLALMPEDIAGKTAVTAIEMDPSTARIAKLLYPEAWVRQEDFTKATLCETFDLAIGNPPFSDRTVRSGDPSGKLGLSLHEYFMARSIERLKPGGLAAFVCSRFAMDRVDSKARAHIGGMADLLGAIRMPRRAMMAASGTEVVVDLLFFQRRAPGQDAGGAAWDSLAEVLPAADGECALHANRYFAEHPEMVLGIHGWTTSPFGPVYTCRRRTETLEADLVGAIGRLPQGIHRAPVDSTAARPAASPRIRVGTAAEGATVKEGSYVIAENRLMQVIDGTPQPVAVKSGKGTGGIFAKHARIIRQMIPVRDALRDVLRAQLENQPWGAAQLRLRVAYGSFVRAFGPINLTTTTGSIDAETGAVTETQRRPNLTPYSDDPDCWLVASIEDYDLETGTAKKGPVFSERVIHPPAEPVIVTAADALAVTLAEVGHPDMDRIAELIGRPRDDAAAELGEAVFLDPDGADGVHTWRTADAYLSGAVRGKLARAEAATARDLRYVRNVEALRRVQPKDLAPSDITARLAAPWIPVKDIEAFSAEIIGVVTTIRHTVEIAAWTVDKGAFAGQAAATSEWGTARRHAGELLDDALHSSIPTIWDIWRDAEGEHREINAAETEAAKEKLAKIKTAFQNWIWTDPDRTDRLARIYNDAYNNLVPRHFDRSHLQLPGASSVIRFYEHQKRVIWRIIASGATYVAHAVGAGKTFSLAAAVMEQKRLGLISKAMMVVPGHCLAQASREFLQLYPTARILVADETNFVAGKRARFIARAATAHWDCIIITHSAFKLIAAPAAFEHGMVQAQIATYSELLERVDGDDRITRKRIENMKEKLEAKLEGLATHKDDMLTIAEIGIDQVIVDEAQEFRKLSFATNMTNLKGVQPDGSQRAWDLYVKTRFIDTLNPGRAIVMASGTPITNTLAEMFTLQRFMQPDALGERGLHEFDAWAANFGDSRTELELQPSGTYKPVTRFAEFVNVADLMAMFRSFADVVLKNDLRAYLKLPRIEGGQRQIITAEPSRTFKWYQRALARRIKQIEERKRRPEKGDDIPLSVITDGRHAAIDLRFVLDDYENEEGNKLNALITKVHAIWLANRENRYLRPDGEPSAIPGAAQMIFSDLGTLNVEAARGFSAYRWIKTCLIARGIPAAQIAYMQDYKKSAAKQRLFGDVNAGRITVLIGSSETMGTGVNAQLRLKALHHLDVPWMPSQIEQRDGRIERQGNQNDEIGIYAYATLGSTDATMWQNNERKQRFINAALSGDTSVRRIEDAGSQVSQFAMAKAIASGDPRLMQKAGLEAEIARLQRQEAAHFDDQHAVRGQLATATRAIATAERRVAEIEQDIAKRTSTRGDLFSMEVNGRRYTERSKAGAALLNLLRNLDVEQKPGDWVLASLGGFRISAQVQKTWRQKEWQVAVLVDRTGQESEIPFSVDLTAMGLISRLEHALDHFDAELAEARRSIVENKRRVADYQPRLGGGFTLAGELAAKLAQLAELETSLAATTDQTGAEADDLDGVVPRLRGAFLTHEQEPDETLETV